jgi:hypothetical protein
MFKVIKNGEESPLAFNVKTWDEALATLKEFIKLEPNQQVKTSSGTIILEMDAKKEEINTYELVEMKQKGRRKIKDETTKQNTKTNKRTN